MAEFDDEFMKRRMRRARPSSALAGTHCQHLAAFWCERRLAEMTDVDIGLRHIVGITLRGCSPRVWTELGWHFHISTTVMGMERDDLWASYCFGSLGPAVPANDDAMPGHVGRWMPSARFVQYPLREAPDWMKQP